MRGRGGGGGLRLRRRMRRVALGTTLGKMPKLLLENIKQGRRGILESSVAQLFAWLAVANSRKFKWHPVVCRLWFHPRGAGWLRPSQLVSAQHP